MPPIVDLVIGVPTSFVRYDKLRITWIDFEIKGGAGRQCYLELKLWVDMGKFNPY
jgi:hypothetical protein